MCRHLAYLGPPVTLDALLLTPERSLCRQAVAPRYQIGTRDNPHGFGAGWYVRGRTDPERYRTATPIWDDAAFAARAATESSGTVLAAVRNATPGATLDELGNAPFTSGPYLFSHNGYVRDFRMGVDEGIRARISARRRDGIEGDSDSETLFAAFLDRVDGGATIPAALVQTVRLVLEVSDGPLNLLATDGRTIAATALGNSLFTTDRCGAVVVASEPLDDDPSWKPIADHSLVVADGDGVDISPLA